MSNWHKISGRDFSRSILTEFVPYEVPLRFSFFHFYARLRTRAKWSVPARTLFDNLAEQEFVEPYSFLITTGERKQRCLGLINPVLLQAYSSIYEEFPLLMISLCGRSAWSLRRPLRVAKTYVIRKTDDPNSDDEPDEGSTVPDPSLPEAADVSQPHQSSFFVYGPYTLLHKFYESPEWLTLERRFTRYIKLDIAKCFANIYTHTLSWAVRGRSWAKHNKGVKASFDSRLDELMRRSNAGETHGILIGAEISRIFAEIILQDVDVKVEAACASAGYVEGRDYSVRRYLDDYFMFFNDSNVASFIETSLERELRSYKLHLNERKRVEYARPFVTGVSLAKMKLSRVLYRELRLPLKPKDESTDATVKPPRAPVADKILQRIREIIAESGLTFADVSSFVLKHLQWRTSKTALNKDRISSEKEVHDWVSAVIHVAFHLLAVDMRFRTTTLVGRLIIDALAICSEHPHYLKDVISSSVVKYSDDLLHEIAHSTSGVGVEISSFLIFLRAVDGSSRLAPQVLKALIDRATNDEGAPDYFCSIAFIYFFGDRIEFADLRAHLLKRLIERVLACQNTVESTELFCLSLDMISCPYTTMKQKVQVLRKIFQSRGMQKPNRTELEMLASELGDRPWLFDWRSNVPTSDYLRKKELSLAY